MNTKNIFIIILILIIFATSIISKQLYEKFSNYTDKILYDQIHSLDKHNTDVRNNLTNINLLNKLFYF